MDAPRAVGEGTLRNGMELVTDEKFFAKSFSIAVSGSSARKLLDSSY